MNEEALKAAAMMVEHVARKRMLEEAETTPVTNDGWRRQRQRRERENEEHKRVMAVSTPSNICHLY